MLWGGGQTTQKRGSWDAACILSLEEHSLFTEGGGKSTGHKNSPGGTRWWQRPDFTKNPPLREGSLWTENVAHHQAFCHCSATPLPQWCAVRGFRMEKNQILALDS